MDKSTSNISSEDFVKLTIDEIKRCYKQSRQRRRELANDLSLDWRKYRDIEAYLCEGVVND